jgi:hypothetical protein
VGVAIPVRPLGTVTGYSSFADAIRAAARQPGQEKARDDSAALHGRHFLTARCDLRRWVIEFSGPAWLQVAAGTGGVDWAVFQDPAEPLSESEPVVFDWEHGPVTAMDCRALAEPRRGAEFWQLRAGEGGLLLYLRGQPILNFHAVERRDTGEVLLFACDDD